MPLVKVDLIEGRSEDQIREILDAAHETVVESFNVPPADRYQIVREHPANRMIIEDTGLGIERSRNIVVLQIVSRPRSRSMKETFYSTLSQRLSERCSIAPSDVVVTFVTNTDEDWSFGHGRAQFLTGEL